MTTEIWLHKPSLEALNASCQQTAVSHLGIQITALGPDYIQATMPADARTFQPFGLIHGGANVLLAETLGSIGANLLIDGKQFVCVGQEINANHLRGVRAGFVTGTARLNHAGRRSQVWTVEIRDEQGHLTCLSRLTVAVIAKSDL